MAESRTIRVGSHEMATTGRSKLMRQVRESGATLIHTHRGVPFARTVPYEELAADAPGTWTSPDKAET